MGIASEMKELTRNIVSSHKDRMKRIGEIREEVKGARVEAQDMIHSFEDSRQETSRQLRGDLVRGEVERKSDSKKMLKGFQSLRREEGSQMRKDLSQDRAARKSEVTGILRGSQNLRREEGAQVRKELAQGLSERRSEFREMRGDFRKAQAEVRADLKGARAAWQWLADTIQARKGRTEMPLETEAPAANEEISDLETKMLAVVNEHPQGITLAGIADSLGVAPVVLGRVSGSLMKKNEIRKKEKLYFPVAGK